jgi:hypothetical protein
MLVYLGLLMQRYRHRHLHQNPISFFRDHTKSKKKCLGLFELTNALKLDFFTGRVPCFREGAALTRFTVNYVVQVSPFS